jgi:glycosyltransferase involved in cell wall biosynthesis
LQRSEKQKKNSGQRLVIGFFGRISREKGFEMLVQALIQVEMKRPGLFDFWVISQHADQEHIEKIFGDKPLASDRIRAINSLTGTDLNPVLANLDVCVIPSLWLEIGPLTLLEAIAQGVPCIVSDSVGMASLVTDRENGRLFPCGDLSALTEALLEVITNPDILNTWRDKLPMIRGQNEYISSLSEIFRGVATKAIINKMA